MGRYWGAKAGKIDIVALDSTGEDLVLGECKYTSSPKGLSVLHALQEKADIMLKLTNAKRVQYLIFGTSGFTQGLTEKAQEGNVRLIEKL